MGLRGLKSPFLPLTLALIIGILIGGHIPLVIPLVTVGVLLPLCFFLWRRKAFAAQLLALAVLIALGAFLIHLRLHPSIPLHHVSKLPDRHKVVLTGTIYRPPQRDVGKTVVYLRADGISRGNTVAPATGRMRITIGDRGVPVRYGYRVRLQAKLYYPHNFRNPGAFDYQGYLRRKGVLITGYVRNGEQIQILSREGGTPLLRLFDRWRAGIEEFLDANTSPPGRGMLKALLIGERGEISDETREAFIAAGAVHILAISGLHLGIIVTLIFFAVQGLLKLSERALLRYDIRKVAALATFPPLLAYILITGFPISTIRAGIMASCFLIAILIDRYRNPLNTLAFAAFIILLVSPTSLWDPSFQLSFSSVLGIIVLTPPLYRLLYPQDPLTLLTRQGKGKIKRAMILSFVASFAAIIVTSPIVAFHFHRVSIMGLISNAVIIPIIGLGVLPLSLLSLPLIPLFPSAGALVAQTAAALSQWGIKAMELIASIPFAATYLPAPTALEMILFYTFLGSLLWIKRPRLKKAALALILVIALLDLSYWGLRGYLQNEFRATYLDVGQGDCALIEFPGGKRMLIDGGGLYGDFDVGENIIAPFLWERRILQVDYLVVSHPEPDHYKGLLFIAQHFRPREFWHSGLTSTASSYRDLLSIIQKKGVRMVRVEDGFVRSIGGVRLKALHPVEGWMPGDRYKRGWVNNNSVVLRIAFGEHTFLFTGDIEKEAEMRLLKAGKDVRAQVLKVPHHGSKTSSTYLFIKTVSPRYAVFPLGYKNIFHFPNKRVANRYESLGCQILRTDLDGAITIISDGKQLEVKTYWETMRSPAGDISSR
ncbi:MAG: DNA internalization-related competence protein ComEC/Rec2 [Deltaproteobacteria bacterium]|nr:DNA internalization-related competence protein ComEC/Rec2 [Deltaproteobacteria bacterium]